MQAEPRAQSAVPDAGAAARFIRPLHPARTQEGRELASRLQMPRLSRPVKFSQ